MAAKKKAAKKKAIKARTWSCSKCDFVSQSPQGIGKHFTANPGHMTEQQIADREERKRKRGVVRMGSIPMKAAKGAKRDNYCRKCGEPTIGSKGKRYCGNCGMTRSSDWMWCPGCGAKVNPDAEAT